MCAQCVKLHQITRLSIYITLQQQKIKKMLCGDIVCIHMSTYIILHLFHVTTQMLINSKMDK